MITKVPTGWVRITLRANAGGSNLTFHIHCDDFYEGDDGSLVFRLGGQMVTQITGAWRQAGLGNFQR